MHNRRLNNEESLRDERIGRHRRVWVTDDPCVFCIVYKVVELLQLYSQLMILFSEILQRVKRSFENLFMYKFGYKIQRFKTIFNRTQNFPFPGLEIEELFQTTKLPQTDTHILSSLSSSSCMRVCVVFIVSVYFFSASWYRVPKGRNSPLWSWLISS